VCSALSRGAFALFVETSSLASGQSQSRKRAHRCRSFGAPVVETSSVTIDAVAALSRTLAVPLGDSPRATPIVTARWPCLSATHHGQHRSSPHAGRASRRLTTGNTDRRRMLAVPLVTPAGPSDTPALDPHRRGHALAGDHDPVVTPW